MLRADLDAESLEVGRARQLPVWLSIASAATVRAFQAGGDAISPMPF